MLADALGKKKARGDHVHAQLGDPPKGLRNEATHGYSGGCHAMELVKVITIVSASGYKGVTGPIFP